MKRRFLDTEMSMPPSYENNTNDSFINVENFDTNMVIILAALLCALICALGLNTIARCAMRCSRRLSEETPEQATTRLNKTGLKKRELSQIPVTVYGGAGEDIPATECPICLGEFEKGDKVRMLPKCNHGFHVRCIDTWLVSHSSCPNCRNSLLVERESKDVVAGDGLPENVSAVIVEEKGKTQGVDNINKDYSHITHQGRLIRFFSYKKYTGKHMEFLH